MRYGRGAPVLQNVSLAIEAGERVALIGPNGAGKSTLLRALVGLLPASAGSLATSGRPLDRAAVHTLSRRMGFVHQSHALVRRLSALSNTVHGLLHQPGAWRAFHQATASAAMRAAAVEALAAVGLAERAGERVDRLSGGQAQRVAIARALVRDPDLMVADEPAASLDPAAGHEIMKTFVRLAEERGRTLIFTSHDMAHAQDYATRLIALKGGRIAFDVPACSVGEARLTELFAA